MSPVSIIFLVVYVSILSVGIFLLVKGAGGAIEDHFISKAFKRLKNDIRESFVNSKPSWEQIKIMLATEGDLSTKHLKSIIQLLIRESLTDKENKLNDKAEILESYLRKIEESEPFDDMPEDIKLLLERIKEKIKPESQILDPLVTHLRNLLKLNSKEAKKHKIMAYAGILLAVIGLSWSIYSHYANKPILNNQGSATDIRGQNVQR